MGREEMSSEDFLNALVCGSFKAPGKDVTLAKNQAHLRELQRGLLSSSCMTSQLPDPMYARIPAGTKPCRMQHRPTPRAPLGPRKSVLVL